MEDATTYAARGVSTGKQGVLAAVSRQDPGLYPGAFCKILPDHLAGSPDHCIIMHADGAGTKAALAYIAWRQKFGLPVWHGIIQDSLVMNLDDAGCAGAFGPFIISSTINRNKFLIPDEIVDALIDGCAKFCAHLGEWGIPCYVAGGETGDVPDLLRTITVDNTLVCRPHRSEVIDASWIGPGDVIVGFSSTGRARWEREDNSGMGSNGFTSARHDILLRTYRERYRETFAPEMASELAYRGNYQFIDVPRGWNEGVGPTLLSPTRTYLPLMKAIVEKIGVSDVHGFIHCSGGGQTKIAKFGGRGNRYVKDNLFPLPPIFELLRNACTSVDSEERVWREMFSVYNMGHRLEAVVPDEDTAAECITTSEALGISARIVGRVEQGDGPERTVVIDTPHGTFTY